jgi:predicted nucleic acid-binding protein
LFGPRSVYWEIGNAFSAMLKRQRVTVKQAKAVIEIFRQISLNLTDVELVKAVELAAQLNLYAYDASSCLHHCVCHQPKLPVAQFGFGPNSRS